MDTHTHWQSQGHRVATYDWGTGEVTTVEGDVIAKGEHAMAFDGMDNAVEQDDFIVGPGCDSTSSGEHDRVVIGRPE